MLASPVLVIGHPRPERMQLGAEFCTNLSDAAAMILEKKPTVIVLPVSQETSNLCEKIMDTARRMSTNIKFVLVQQGASSESLVRLHSLHGFARFARGFEDSRLERMILETLEDLALERQDRELLELFDQQNQKLTSLSQELETLVESRQKFFESARGRLIAASSKFQSLHKAFVAIHSAANISEIEHNLTRALEPIFRIEWIRITFQNQSDIESSLKKNAGRFKLLALPLKRGLETIGQILFARALELTFRAEDEDFLIKVSEAVSLAVDRLTQLELAESLNYEWDTTFNSIAQPVSIIDAGYNLVRVNQGYLDEVHQQKSEDVLGHKCYQMLFGRTLPCEECKLGTSFHRSDAETSASKRTGKRRAFNVTSTRLDPPDESASLFVTLYTDVSERLKLERKVMESAKSVELGLIGGSIAHELNNPMAGIITFLQLIKMDLKGNEPYADDIREMERGAQRCKEIIENLLSFARKDEGDRKEFLDLKDVVRRAVRIIELKSRSLGIDIVETTTPDAIPIFGSRNLLAQCFINLLQSSIERILLKRKQSHMPDPRIEITLTQDGTRARVEIQDNGDIQGSTQRQTGLGITVSRHILQDHEGSLRFIQVFGDESVVAKDSSDMTNSTATIVLPLVRPQP